jgi:hypothetical protein
VAGEKNRVEVLIELRDQLTGELKKVNRALGKTDDAQGKVAKGAKQNSKSFNALKGATAQLGKALAGLAAAYLGVQTAQLAAQKTLEFYKSVLEAGFNFEKWEVAFAKMLGGAEAAEEQLRFLTEFAAKTPFQLPEIIEASKLLEALNLDTKTYLATLGDVSAFLDRDIRDAVLAVGNAARGEFESLKTFGVDIGIIFERAGIDITSSQRRTAEDSKKIVAALMDFWQERFGGGMVELSKTASGQISNIEDAWWNFKLAVAQSGVQNEIKEQLTDALNTIERMNEDGTLKEIAQDLSDIATEMVRLARVGVEATASLTGLADEGGKAFRGYLVNLRGFRGTLEDITGGNLFTKLEGINVLLSTFSGFEQLKLRGLEETAEELGLTLEQFTELDEASRDAIAQRIKDRKAEIEAIENAAAAMKTLKEEELERTGIAIPFKGRATRGGAAAVASGLAREIAGLPPIVRPAELPPTTENVENAKKYTGQIKQADNQVRELMSRFALGPTFAEMLPSAALFREQVDRTGIAWEELAGGIIQTKKALTDLRALAGDGLVKIEETTDNITVQAAELAFLAERFGLGPTINELTESTSSYTQGMDFAQQSVRNLGTTMFDAITSGIKGFGDLSDSVASFVVDLGKAIIKMVIFNILLKGIGGPFGALFKGGGSVSPFPATSLAAGGHVAGGQFGFSIAGSGGPDRVPALLSADHRRLETGRRCKRTGHAWQDHSPGDSGRGVGGDNRNRPSP